MREKKAVSVVEVCPRDGFQNIKEFIPTELKIDVIKRILDSGVKRLQITAFVHPKAIPQLKDAKEIVATIMNQYPDVKFCALVPNLYGVQVAKECGIKEVNYVISVSESHNKANINRTVDQSFEELDNIRQKYPDMNVIFEVVTAFGCPFEGEIPLEKLLAFVDRAVRLGSDTIDICDTIGVAYPTQVERAFGALQKQFGKVEFGAHIHDTRNMGMLNTWVAIESGISFVQTSLGGLGGCPYAPGATGNTATEDLVYMLDRCGVETGIDFAKLLAASKFMRGRIEGNYSGHHMNIDTNCYDQMLLGAADENINRP